MNIRLLLSGLVFLTLSVLCYSQEVVKETVKEDGVNSNITITTVGMYDGTESEKAEEYFFKASEYAAKNDFKNAEKYYLKAIKEDHSYVEAYDNLGLVYRRLEAFDKAIDYYKKSIELYPDGHMAHLNLAVVYGIQRDYKSAINEYEKILRISPNDPEGYFGLASSYMMLSQFDIALVNANKALDLYKENNSHHIADGYHMVGLINYYQGDKESAKKYMQLAKDGGAKIHPQLEAELFSK